MKIDLDIESIKIMKKMKPFKRAIKDKAELILHDFENPIRSYNYKGTDYFEYICTFITLDGRPVLPGNHRVDLPKKTCWNQLYHYLKSINAEHRKDIRLTISKIDNYTYSFDSIESIE